MLGCGHIDGCRYIYRGFLIITTDPLRGSRCWVASYPTLSISDAERRVYHNRRVSNALHHHRISDTMMMSTHPLVARTSALTARYCSRVADTAVVQADERRVVRGTKKGRTEARPYDRSVLCR